MMELLAVLDQYTWIFATTFVVAFFLAFGMGANDVANSFATTVGAKVLTLKQACIIAAFAEFLGAVLLGGRVTDTIKKGITDPAAFEDEPEMLMLGMFCATVGTAIWLNLATFLKLPVSASHSVVAAIMGFTLVAKGASAIDWFQFGMIALSWVVSPLLSGIISIGVYLSVKFGIFKRPDPFEAGLAMVPFIYAITIFVNLTPVVNQVFEMVEKIIRDSKREEPSPTIPGEPTLSPTPTDWEPEYQSWVPLVSAISAGVFFGLVTGLVVAFYVIPRQRKSITIQYSLMKGNKINAEDERPLNDEPHHSYGSGEIDPLGNPEQDPQVLKAEQLFNFLQILTATFGSFVHGSNDVSNAIGPLAAVYSIWITGLVDSESSTPIWILAYGGVGIVVGLALWGRRVIETVGTNLTKLTPSRGFTVEIGSALTVLVASRIGVPVSTTHCKIGSVVAVGYASNDGAVSWKLMGTIFFSWVATIPAAGLVAAGLFAALRPAL